MENSTSLPGGNQVDVLPPASSSDRDCGDAGKTSSALAGELLLLIFVYFSYCFLSVFFLWFSNGFLMGFYLGFLWVSYGFFIGFPEGFPMVFV